MKKILKKTKQKARASWNWIKQNKLFCAGYTLLGISCIAQALPDAALAWNVPVQNSFGYDVYEIAIKKIAQGPIGFVAGSACLGGALFTASRSAWVPAAILAISGGLIYKLDSVASSLGFII